MERDDGFTLVELMMVIAIIAVMISMGIAGLINLRYKAEDSNAKTLVRDASVAQRGLAVQDGAFSDDTVTVLPGFEQSLPWAAGGSTVGTVVVRAETDSSVDDVVCLSSRSESGRWYMIWMHVDDVTMYGVDTATDDLDPCVTAAPATAGTATWSATGW